MSTVVCQTLGSSIEPQSLSLKLNFSVTEDGWGSIQALSNACARPKETSGKADVYVHPVEKRSASALSDKSLEMCTENLGSETGTDVTEDDVFSIMLSNPTFVRERRRKPAVEDRRGGYESLPPPLTILRGENSIRVQPHRENGRLVMTAVSTSARRSSIRAERCDGRLTMCLVEDVDEGVASNGEEESGEEREGLNGVVDHEEDLDRDGTSLVVGGKVGRGEIQRPSRCKESELGRRRLNKWETFWVAI